MVGSAGLGEDGKPNSPRPLPTVATLRKIVMRDLTATPPDGDPEQDSAKYSMEVFVWYYSKLLPWATGS